MTLTTEKSTSARELQRVATDLQDFHISLRQSKEENNQLRTLVQHLRDDAPPLRQQISSTSARADQAEDQVRRLGSEVSTL